MKAIGIIREAHNRQVSAKTRWLDETNPDDAPAFARARKTATACLRVSDYPELSEIAPTAGDFQVAEFFITRRKVDQIDNIYATLLS